MIKPEGLNIFTGENGYGLETVAMTPDGERIIKRYIGDLDFVLKMARVFLMGEDNDL